MITPLTANAAPEPPWYRQGWPWAIIAIPATSVVLGIMMIVLAVQSDDALVVDDWYKEGKTINRRIERDRAATSSGVGALIERAPDGIALSLNAIAPDFAPPATLRLEWVHVTDAARDGGATLAAVGGGRYVAAGATLPTDGRWRLHLAPASTDTTASDEHEPPAIDNQGGGAQDWRLVSERVELRADSAIALGAPAAAERGPLE